MDRASAKFAALACRDVATLAAAHGYVDVYAGWEDEIDRVLAFDFSR